MNIKPKAHREARSSGANPINQVRDLVHKYGADVLTESQLMQILTGKTPKSSLHKLSRMDIHELQMIEGFGPRTAEKVYAIFEVARRINQDSDEEKIFFYYPEQVYAYFGPMLRDMHKERFIVAYLNSAKQFTGYDIISTGGANATVVDPNEVLRTSILKRAHTIILVHNHPSGNPRPSSADVQLTKRIVTSARMLGMDVADHLIVAGYEWSSFKQLAIID